MLAQRYSFGVVIYEITLDRSQLSLSLNVRPRRKIRRTIPKAPPDNAITVAERKRYAEVLAQVNEELKAHPVSEGTAAQVLDWKEARIKELFLK